MAKQEGAGGGNIVLKLSALMFLQFFMWGAWYLSVGVYMNAHGMDKNVAMAYGAGPLSAIVTPIIMGLIVDRFFNMEKVLAALFFIGGLVMFAMPHITGPVAGMEQGVAFIVLIFIHLLCYMPTLGLTASLSFHHLPEGSIQFPRVRMWGTIGWIVAGFVLAFCFHEGNKSPVQFYLAGAAGIALGALCLSLPATPAPKKGQPVDSRSLLFMDAWAQMKNPSFLVFILCSFLVCIPLAAYYSMLQLQLTAMGVVKTTALQNIGTFFEAGMMFAMAWFLRKLGVKKLIFIGIAAWITRYVLFAVGAPLGSFGLVLVTLGIALHGVCYDFFFVTGQIYVDNSTPSNVRGQCQGMNILFTQGIGMWIGAMVISKFSAGVFGELNKGAAESLSKWPTFWWPLAGFAAIVMVVFLLFFKDEGKIEGNGAH